MDMFSMAPLLAHSELVPVRAREILKAAWNAPETERPEMLRAAAHVLHRETGLDCSDVKELVGLV